MSSPVSVAQFMVRTIMPQDDVTQLESSEPGFVQACLDDNWDLITSRLRKRYDVAKMQADPPRVALKWLVKLTTRDCYDKRGNNPSSLSDEKAIYGAAERAELDLKEAADSQTGLYDLPLLASSSSSGVTKGGPLGYTETSPYVWTSRQACQGRREDGSGRGGGVI